MSPPGTLTSPTGLTIIAFSSTTARWVAAGSFAFLVSACADRPSDAVLSPTVEFAAVTDSAGSPFEGTVSLSALGEGIVLPERAVVRVTILERNAAWWHSLSVVSPEIRLLAGPGYLFPGGPPFELGPYEPGPVIFRLDAYNPREPHQFYGTATAQISGSFPSWTIGFEDGLDNDFDDIIISVQALPPPEMPEMVVIRPADGSFTVRPDGTGDNTLAIEIGVFDGAGNPLPDRTVELSFAAVDGTGGHAHPVPTTPAALGELSQTTVNTGADGTITVTYQPGIASGDRELLGTSPGATEAVETITVAVGGLVELGSGANYVLIGSACCPWHPGNHFGTGGLVSALQNLATQFFDKFGERLEFNDMSLVSGGIFDLKQDYMPKHSQHRVGRNVDLRTRTFQAEAEAGVAKLAFIQDEWKRLGGDVLDETETDQPHYHLTL